ncbi:thiol-disulfide oxidoreductase ResA [Sutcliffiella horikoshii]|uniref:Thiol-disulfide oxidoreductase ResA n=1 Tax=Sutcliffiella horikoshii TaxID=79883 RepID=A0AA95B656_9BACI|nr:thiol-disulfide oxidoreductase ResA [Sutcliffiella horikoshii]TYS58118.1 thiol-disulfide oxidoreductase ResA [Sutcliffiella horikoshii]
MNKKNKRLIYRTCVITTLVIMVGYTMYTLLLDNNSTQSIVGNEAAKFVGESMNDEIIELEELKGEKVILNFWGSWCEPCKREMPAFEKVYNNKEVNIISVNLGDSNLVVNEFIQRYNLSFPVIVDRDSSIKQSYKIDRLPASFLINSEGIIEDYFEGEISEQQLNKWSN